MTVLVENETGDKGPDQLVKALERHIKFRSHFKSGGEAVEDFKYWQDGRSGGHMVGCTF